MYFFKSNLQLGRLQRNLDVPNFSREDMAKQKDTMQYDGEIYCPFIKACQ